MNQIVQAPPSRRVRVVQQLLHWASIWREEVRPPAFLLITLQLGLMLLVMHVFQIEEQFGLLGLTPLIFVGFIVHALLPVRYRLPFFLVLSLAAIGTVLGVKQGVGLIAIGLGLIGLCHLPVAFRMRVVLLLGAGAFLVSVRGGWIETSWTALPSLVLPVLGAMFMFRLIIYLYDLRHEKTPASFWERLSYFFMLPNVCFLLFPVVDYQTFRRTYYDGDSAHIYQKGVLWMYRGVVHLLLYRVVYYYFIPDPAEVATLGGVVQAMLTTYLLYLRISGQFHLIIGMMCLFGFNLPETHHLYFLASSFNDYWRRINIYWKDFMMKIFYYPSFMKLRRWGTTTALVASTLIVFAGTWLLHSYQWFWLRGQFPLTVPDALFWGILGGFVVVNSLLEARRSRKRVIKKKSWDVREAAWISVKTVGMFVVICVLWSLWSSPSIGAWIELVAQAGNSRLLEFALLLLGVGTCIGLGVLLQYAASRGWTLTLAGNNPSSVRSVLVTSSGLLLLLGLGIPRIHEPLGPDVAAMLASIQQQQLNQYDEERMERGYYEGLLQAEKYTSALARIQLGQADNGGYIRNTSLARLTGDVIDYELLSSYEGDFRHASYRTNQWGMRDKEYTQAKSPQAYRIALLGASYEMGSGVGNEEIFEALVEDRLNAEHAAQERSYEILNFAVAGYSAVQYVVLTQRNVFAFQPDAVFYAVHSSDHRRLITYLKTVIRAGITIPYPFVQELLERSGVEPDMDDATLEEHVAPFLMEIVHWSLREVAAACREHGVLPVLLFVPITSEIDGMRQERIAQASQWLRWGEEAGFVVLSLEGAYRDYEKASVRVAPWDGHPNPLGHRLLADRLYEVLLEHETLLGLNLATQPAHVEQVGLLHENESVLRSTE